ncbi:unnamed protein product [Effrenium voratum]|nr:unnamed protein product [Effrenium voratum]
MSTMVVSGTTIVTKAVQVISLGETTRAVELGTLPAALQSLEEPKAPKAPKEKKKKEAAKPEKASTKVEEKPPQEPEEQKKSESGQQGPPLEAATFHCVVTKEGQPLGIRVEFVRDKCIVLAVTQGAIPSWNAANPDQAVRPGDCILEVNGKAANAAQLAEKLAEVSGQVSLKMQRPGEVSVPCQAEQKLGIKVSELQDGFGLEVTKVKSDGQIPIWNQEQLSKVHEGDRIVAVNGKPGDSKELFNLIADNGNKELLVYTYS